MALNLMEGFCCPVPSKPRLNGLNRSGVLFQCTSLLRQLEQLEHSCHLQLLEWSDTVVPCRAKEHPLHPRRSYFAPINSPLDVFNLGLDCLICICLILKQWANGLLVEAPGTAPGSEWFIPMSIYRHSRNKPAPLI